MEHNTKQLYRKLIETILIDNNISQLLFLNGKSTFADNYSSVIVTPLNSNKLRVYYKDRRFIPSTSNFYFDFTLDYARLLDMIETDLFNIQHSVEPQYFNIIFNNG